MNAVCSRLDRPGLISGKTPSHGPRGRASTKSNLASWPPPTTIYDNQGFHEKTTNRPLIS
eukprot:895401-Pelagomonas_calceolata.AAC.1